MEAETASRTTAAMYNRYISTKHTYPAVDDFLYSLKKAMPQIVATMGFAWTKSLAAYPAACPPRNCRILAALTQTPDRKPYKDKMP